MLMKVNAARWIDTLQSSESDTFDHLKAAFFKRFIENDEWTDFIKMGQLRQESQEPVIAYLERALVLAKRVQLPEKHEIRALIQGLRPQIQTFVIQQKVVSFDALKEAALLAEKSLRPMSSTDDVISAFRHLEDAIRNNQHVVPDTVQSVSPPTVTPLQTTENGQPLQSTRPQRTRYTSNQSPRQFPLQGAQQPRTAWNRPNRQPLTSGEQQQCYRCLKNHLPKNCSFVHSRCFYCGVTGHIKAACKRRLASQTSQQVSRVKLKLQNNSKNSNQFYKFRELKLHPEKQNSEKTSNFLVSTSISKNYIEARVNRHFSKILLDTGSNFSLAHADFVKNTLCLPVQEASHYQTVMTACGQRIVLKNVVNLTITVSGMSMDFIFYVTDALNPRFSVIVGLDFFREFNAQVDLLNNVVTFDNERAVTTVISSPSPGVI